MRSDADAQEDRAAGVVPKVRSVAPWRLEAVEALPEFRLRVRFMDGTTGFVELSNFLNSAAAGVFIALRDENLFRRVRIELGAVTWPGNLDLAPDAMYRAIKSSGTWIVQ